MNKLSFFLAVTLFAANVFAGTNICSCYPIPESKKYIGDARQYETFGYRIHWTCDYFCTINDGGKSVKKTMRAEYNEKFYGAENGIEGICEGMTYDSEFNADLNREVYVWKGEKVYFNPMKSSSRGLKIWAEQNNCQGGGWFD